MNKPLAPDEGGGGAALQKLRHALAFWSAAVLRRFISRYIQPLIGSQKL